jgi:hypothetical protein
MAMAQIIARIIIAGIAANDHLIIKTTIDPKGILTSVTTTSRWALDSIVFPLPVAANHPLAILDAERQPSAAAGSGSAADAGGRQLQCLVQVSR